MSYANQPYGIVHAYKVRKRRKRFAIGAGLAGTGALFGTKTGRGWLRAGASKLGQFHAPSGRVASSGLRSLFNMGRRAKSAIGATEHGARALTWLKNAKAWASLLPHL